MASGATSAIRELIADRPRSVRAAGRTAAARLARELVAPAGRAVRFEDGRWSSRPGTWSASAGALPPWRATRRPLPRVEPVGDDLESVYAYLHERARGVGR